MNNYNAQHRRQERINDVVFYLEATREVIADLIGRYPTEEIASRVARLREREVSHVEVLHGLYRGESL